MSGFGGAQSTGAHELDPRIKIRAPLRCDGIGRLDCAEDLQSGRRLAVRWLPLDANGDAAVRACERLPMHPTLPKIRQTGQVGNAAFLALDFPEGALLSTMLGDRLESSLVLQLASCLADALATVHEQGVVHGELSSESVLMVPGGKAYLWDMPLVIANRLTDRRGENRLMQNLVRSAAFLAPERARGAVASVPSDVYSLACVVCVAAGAPLPESPTTLGVVHAVASGAWVPSVPEVPQPYRSVVQRMLSAGPARRLHAKSSRFALPRESGTLVTVREMPAIVLPMAALAPMELDFSDLREATEPTAKTAAVAKREPATDEIPQAVAASERPSEVVTPIGNEPVRAASADDVPEMSQADVLKLPTVEMPVVQLVPVQLSGDAAPTPPVPPGVALTENISVSPELVRDGAKAINEDEEDAPRMSKAVWALAAVMATAIMVLLVIAVNLAAKHAAHAALPPASAPVLRPAVSAPAPTEPEEELAPLMNVKKHSAPKASRSQPEPRHTPATKAATSQVTPEPASDDDADDENRVLPPPREGLKRPEL